jgi:hypothetical protein
MYRLTEAKSTLFQWLAVALWVPTGQNSVPTDSGVFLPALAKSAANEGHRCFGNDFSGYFGRSFLAGFEPVEGTITA